MPRPTGKRGQRAYYSERHKPAIAHRDSLVLQLRRYTAMYPAGTRVAIDLQFYVSGSHGDGDNMEKLVLDALQAAGVIANDRQVRRMRWSVDTLAETGRREQCTVLRMQQL